MAEPNEELIGTLRTMWEQRRPEVLTMLEDATSMARSLRDAGNDRRETSQGKDALQKLTHQLVGVFGVYRLADLAERMRRIDRLTNDGCHHDLDRIVDELRSMQAELRDQP